MPVSIVRVAMNTVRSLMQMALGKRLPISSGALEVAGVSGPVRIGRDSYGVAYVDAASDTDAWFGTRNVLLCTQ